MGAKVELTINAFEMARIIKVLEAVRAGDWLAFKTLSDEPFINEEAIHESFNNAWRTIDWSTFVPEEAIKKGKKNNRTGHQFIFIVLKSLRSEYPINLAISLSFADGREILSLLGLVAPSDGRWQPS